VTAPWDIWSREEDNFVKVENPYPNVWAQPADQQQPDQCDQVDLLRLDELQGVADGRWQVLQGDLYMQIHVDRSIVLHVEKYIGKSEYMPDHAN
jgi:hypothetical protein